MKKCSRCREEKPHADFYACTHGGLKGLHAWCKDCFNDSVKQKRQKNPEPFRTRERAQRIKHSAKKKAWQRKHNVELHGISVSARNLVLERQGCACALCRRPLSIEQSRIDHCHACLRRSDHKARGKQECGCPLCIRGLLCDRCNHVILPYLEKHPWMQSEFVARYLQSRPFIAIESNAVNALAAASS